MNLNGKTINPGEMRTQVTLQNRTLTSQTGGFQAPAWATIATVWSRWNNVHGAEAWQASAIQAVDAATVLIRWRTGIDTSCALLKDAVRYEIVSVDNIQDRDEYLELKVRLMKTG